MRVTTTDTFPAELDDIAAASPDGTFFHTSTWARGLADAIRGFSLRCVIAEDGGAIRGYLPYVLIPRGPVAVAWSMPFGTYGGPVVRPGTGEPPGEAVPRMTEVHRRLIARFERDTSGARVVDSGWVDYGNLLAAAGDDELETHVIPLAGGFDALWSERFARQRRQRARRAERLGVSIRGADGAADLDAFYAIYAERMRALGSEHVHPLDVFARVLEGGGDRVRLFVAEHEGRIVGGHFNFYFRDTAFIWYGITSPAGDELQAGTLLYVECIRAACAGGCRFYNLGSSLGKGSLIDFKESLGGEPHRYRIHRRRSKLGGALAAVKRLKRRLHV